MTIDNYEIKKEICNFLRNQDILTITNRGVTTTTDEFNGDGNTKTFQLTNSGVRNIRSVTVDGSPVSYGTDYTIDFEETTAGLVTFAVDPGSGTNNVDVEYDYGTTDSIFPDLPRDDLSLSSYPRISVTILDVVTADAGVGGSENQSAIMVQIIVYSKGIRNLDNYVKVLRDAVRSNKKSFYNFKFLTPRSQGPSFKSPERDAEVVQVNSTFEITNYWES